LRLDTPFEVSVRICLLTVALSALITVPASAATFTASSDCDRSGCRHAAVLRAAPGERNAVTVTSTAPRVTEIRDSAAPITLGATYLCQEVDAHAVRCTAPEREYINFKILLGDGDDTASSDNANVYGGPGADHLTGQSGTLSGGPGPDELTAGPEGVAFLDDDGARPAQDRYIGSKAPDTLAYRGRDSGVRVDLAGGRVGPDRDAVTDVEDVIGGNGDDVLMGNRADNTLEGEWGADRIVGGAGEDTIYTGIFGGIDEPDRAGPDRVDAGAGKDTVHVTTRQSGGDRIRCGTGHDEVLLTKHRDLLRGCEIVGPGDTLQHARLRERLPSSGAVFLRAPACDCRYGGYVARAGRALVARARGRRGTVRLRLDATGRQLLASRGRLTIAVTYRGEFEQAGFRTVLRLRRP
jgi:hypothetical protein